MQSAFNNSPVDPHRSSASDDDTSQDCMSLSAQCICYDIRLTRVVLQSKVVVRQIFHPSSQPHIQVLLCEDMPEAIVIREDLELLPIKIVSPGLECMNYSCQLEVMSRIVLLMNLELTRSEGPDSSLLH